MSTRIHTLSRAAIMVALLIAVLARPTLAAPAQPCTTVCYVDTNTGNDANDGFTPATAKKTIQAGVNQVSVGGTVNVAAGVYAENVTIAKSLTLTGAGQTNDAAGTVLEGTGMTGSAILVNTGVTNVTIQNLRAQNYSLSAAAGVYANGQNNNFTIQNVTSVNNGIVGNNGGGVYMNGPVNNVLIDHVTATNNRSRGIVIWNGFKTNITITNNTVTGNNCCGIELQDGTASGVTVTGNTVSGNVDSGMAFTGLMSGMGANRIANNTLTNNGRFGIEIKLANGTGATSGDGSIVVENNNVTLSTPPSDLRDFAGIAAFRRGWVSGNNNVDIPTGVVIRNNTVTGYMQNNVGSNSEGFGIVVEGTNMTVTGNTLTNNEVGVQVQAGHLPYVANTNTDGDQSNLADQFFGRGNSPVGCALITSNTFSGNGTDTRNVGAGGGVVTNVNTAETFCTIQSAINDSDTINGHTLEVSPGTYAENVIVNKSVTINGANAGVSPNDPGNPVNPNPARSANESIVAVTGGGNAFRVQAANVTIDGFKFTDANVAQANVQAPIIGAGGNFGGDAPGVKIINNLFYQTNRMVVYFLGPSLMQGGTVDDNRVQDPDRPDTGCTGATAPSNCGHQLFNLWSTNNLSFQGNVTIAAQASGDRIRTLNISSSTNVTLADNTVRYTCTYTCFTIAAGTTNNVTMTGNDLVTDVGNVIQIFSDWSTTGGTINVNHNILTAGADFPIVVDDLNADLDNVHINRNAVISTVSPTLGITPNARNGNDSLTIPGAETLDVECNWWGNAAEPTGFFGPNDHTPWLYTADLDGPCFVGGTITVAKETTPNGDPADFEFDPSWGANFTLSDGESATSPILPAGNYSVAEVNLASPWVQTGASCDNAATGPVETVNPSAITLADGDAWTCTFQNKYLPLCTTVCYADAAGGSDSNGGTSPADAFKTIQKAIDTVTAGGEVRVLPGTYDQDEKNGVDPVTGGAGGNDFNIFVHKANITIQGVTAGDVDITTAAGAQAIIKPKRNQPTFGSSAMFIQADGVTVQGVKFAADNGAAYADKIVEIIGNDVTVNAVAFDVTDGAVGIYVSDFSYDAVNNVSTVQDFTFTNGLFTSANQTGLAVQVASGAGWPDNVGTRTISGNTFSNLDDALTFAGAGSAGWRLYPVGTADITGNTFSQIKRRHVMAWGNYPIANPTSLGYADPDWCGILANNTFDKATFLWEGTTRCPAGEPRRWDAASGNPAPYDYFRNVAGIYSAIQQYGVGKAVSGDLLEVFPGTYVEQVTVNKTMTLLGHGPATTFIKAPATLPNTGTQDSIIVKITGAGVQVEMSEFTVTGPGPSGCGSIGYGIFVRDGAYANIHDNKVVDVKDTGLSGCQNGNAIGVGRQLWNTSGTADITDNEISTYQKTGIIVDNTGSSATIEGNTVSGDGPIAYIAENGIQVSRGATAEINDNTITGHSYAPFTATSSGILLYLGGTVNTDGNTVTQNQIGIDTIDTSGTHKNNVVTATAAGTGSPGFWGIVVDAPPPNRTPSPADAEVADVAAPATVGPNPPAVVQTVVVTGNTFTSNNSAGGVGVEADAGYGSLDINVTVTKNLIHNWETGVAVVECTGGGCAASTFSNVDVNRNSIVGNTDGFYADTVDPNETDGTCNWWGNASGPSDAGPGTGDTVSTEVDFTPWLYSSDLDGPCYVGGTISIDKVAAGGGATQFTFDVSWSATDVTLTDASAPYVTAPPLQAGNYSISEISLPSGWAQQSATCDNTATTPVETVNPSSITVADGDAWLCTFTNARQGTIQIAKVAAGGGATQFTFDVSWSATDVTLTDGQSTTPVSLAAGNYTITEINIPTGWAQQSATCDNTATTPVETVNPASITVANGDTWVCTFTNVIVQGTIKIAKVAAGGGATQFTFDVSWSATDVTLTDGQSTTPVSLAAGNYTITEINIPTGWAQQSATCDNTATTPVETVNPASITVANGDAWACTFTNVYTPPPSNTCAVPGTQYTDLLGIGMGNTKKHKATATIKLPNYTNLVDLYGQLVAKVPGDAKYVRFIMPGKNNYVQVNAITAPSEHQYGNFWYGADIPWATTPPKQVKGQWFLQKSGTKNHIPRAFVLYATYQHATNRYVNVWDTFTPSEGEVYWDVAQGWTPTRVLNVPIAAPLGPTTFNVELALVDNDKDARPVWVTVTAGNVSQTQQPTNPSNGEQLNLMTFTLANVPAGTNQIVIKVYSPSPTIDGFDGDSATLVGMAANYLCAPISTP
ncbi:MAG: right-handed parallel beta-helix repeat-containing protein [Candidatus Promineofilum sp.]|nr:right-handed parallel beta-helix repeat-containing protein [Promineifilum sp.]